MFSPQIDIQSRSQNQSTRRMLRREERYTRCRYLADTNYSRDPATWHSVVRVLDRLDVGAFSDDESDSPAGGSVRVVRRVALPWINPALSEMLHAVDTFEDPLSRRRHRPIRNLQFIRRDTARRAVSGLPVNWYNPDWLSGLPPAQVREVLRPCRAIAIPTLRPREGHHICVTFTVTFALLVLTLVGLGGYYGILLGSIHLVDAFFWLFLGL
ncbi:hypothetical protein BV22DRAFT_1135982 [Leucogyrophana mollusca]|uniref:Uncharacterized protein n=1 Tax=Leucogyrophana mollusca TaxID=85980 RepID=A0ACB8AVF4_9AGAM|nr:hypothetical protein BV22DRAFT_1135982 [Leucogyrophana mollusca]